MVWNDEDALNDRMARLETQITAAASNGDAQVRALYTGMRALVAEVTRRRRQVEETCETLTQVLEATSDAFIALDADWRYTYVNDRAGRLFGRDAESLIGKHIWTEFPEAVGQPFQIAFEQSMVCPWSDIAPGPRKVHVDPPVISTEPVTIEEPGASHCQRPYRNAFSVRSTAGVVGETYEAPRT